METRVLNYGQTEVTCKEVRTCINPLSDEKYRKYKQVIEVDINTGLDECIDYPTIETELSNNTSLFLTNLFQKLH